MSELLLHGLLELLLYGLVLAVVCLLVGYAAGRLHAGLKLRRHGQLPGETQHWFLKGSGDVVVVRIACAGLFWLSVRRVFFRRLDKHGPKGPVHSMPTETFLAQAHRLAAPLATDTSFHTE